MKSTLKMRGVLMIRDAQSCLRLSIISRTLTLYLEEMMICVFIPCATPVSTSCGHNYTMYNVVVKLVQKKTLLIFSGGSLPPQRKENLQEEKNFSWRPFRLVKTSIKREFKTKLRRGLNLINANLPDCSKTLNLWLGNLSTPEVLEGLPRLRTLKPFYMDGLNIRQGIIFSPAFHQLFSCAVDLKKSSYLHGFMEGATINVS